MGHSEEVNRDVYQAPLALMGITRIGKQLLEFDKEGKIITLSLITSNLCSSNFFLG